MLYCLEHALWTSVQGIILVGKPPESSRDGMAVVDSRAKRIEKRIGLQRIYSSVPQGKVFFLSMGMRVWPDFLASDFKLILAFRRNWV